MGVLEMQKSHHKYRDGEALAALEIEALLSASDSYTHTHTQGRTYTEKKPAAALPVNILPAKLPVGRTRRKSCEAWLLPYKAPGACVALP